MEFRSLARPLPVGARWDELINLGRGLANFFPLIQKRSKMGDNNHSIFLRPGFGETNTGVFRYIFEL
jgi:hypothetical protein